MKKIILTIFSLIFIISMNAQSFSFDTDNLFIGGGVSYGTKAKLGLNIKNNYGITDDIFVSTSLNLFMPSKTDSSGIQICSALSTFNLDGQYRFNLKGYYIYPFIGLNVARTGIIIDSKVQPDIISFGLNLGAGAKLWDRVYVELKYNTNIKQLVFSAGYVMDYNIIKGLLNY